MSGSDWLIVMAIAVPVGMLIGAILNPRLRMRVTVLVLIFRRSRVTFIRLDPLHRALNRVKFRIRATTRQARTFFRACPTCGKITGS
jgi:hypothetical protein